MNPFCPKQCDQISGRKVMVSFLLLCTNNKICLVDSGAITHDFLSKSALSFSQQVVAKPQQKYENNANFIDKA